MIAASPEISRYEIVFAAAHVFNSLDDHHETKSSRQFLPTENPEGPLSKGGFHMQLLFIISIARVNISRRLCPSRGRR
jgi:hypothetical protein